MVDQVEAPISEGAASDATRCTYEEFGALFFRAAVTPERILGAVDGIAGEPIDFGPMGVGPGKIAQVTAKGQIGEATATELPGTPISYELVIPVDLDFTINLQVEKERFHASVEVPLVVAAHGCSRSGVSAAFSTVSRPV